MNDEQNERLNEETPAPPEEKNEVAENCIIRFLTERHADDEHALDIMTKKLAGWGEIPDDTLELFYQDINYNRDLETARNESYLKGKNEKIECIIKEQNESMPVDDGGLPEQEDSLTLRHLRPSVWDD